MKINSDLSALALRCGNSQPPWLPSTDPQVFKLARLARSSGQPAALAVPLTLASIPTLEAVLLKIEPGSGILSMISGSATTELIGYHLDVVGSSGGTVISV